MKEPEPGRSRAREARGACPAQVKSPRYWAKGLLVLLSIAVGVVAGEVALRLLHPRYAFAAQSPPREARAGWPTYRRSSDPDTGKEHYVIRNNLDGRQSRNFDAANLDGAVNIGFFGDSQTENYLMPAQYSYTEPLDYFLNLGPLPRLGGQDARFNVLNFGVRGTGTGRAYLRWRGLPARRQLAHVFYMVSSNDLGDLGKAIRAGIVRLGEAGDVLAGGPQPTPPWKRLLARLHLTYLAIDAWHRVAADESGGARVAAPAEVYPLRPADLPAAAPGYANLDFAWEGKGALADGDCRVSAALPDFPIAFLRTGQYRGGILPRRLWNARIDFAEVERARRATAP